jgi:hypothetical protein
VVLAATPILKEALSRPHADPTHVWRVVATIMLVLGG